MSTTRRMPACSAPGISTVPSFGAPKETVSSARTASPSTTPVAPFTPEGMSTATTGTPASFRLAIADAHSSSGIPRKPVPKIASTATSARASSRRRPCSSNVRTRMPGTSSRRRAFVAAGSRSSSGSSSSTTVVRTPHRPSCRAATRPSPPLLPFPQTTTARRPYEPPASSRAARATARPARSISTSAATPRACVSRSSDAASSGVRTGFIGRRSRTPRRSIFSWLKVISTALMPSASARRFAFPSRRIVGAPDGSRVTLMSSHRRPR